MEHGHEDLYRWQLKQVNTIGRKWKGRATAVMTVRRSPVLEGTQQTCRRAKSLINHAFPASSCHRPGWSLVDGDTTNRGALPLTVKQGALRASLIRELGDTICSLESDEVPGSEDNIRAHHTHIKARHISICPHKGPSYKLCICIKEWCRLSLLLLQPKSKVKLL